MVPINLLSKSWKCPFYRNVQEEKPGISNLKGRDFLIHGKYSSLWRTRKYKNI